MIPWLFVSPPEAASTPPKSSRSRAFVNEPLAARSDPADAVVDDDDRVAFVSGLAHHDAQINIFTASAADPVGSFDYEVEANGITVVGHLSDLAQLEALLGQQVRRVRHVYPGDVGHAHVLAAGQRVF